MARRYGSPGISSPPPLCSGPRPGSAPPCWRPPGHSRLSPRRSTATQLSGCPPDYGRWISSLFATVPTAVPCSPLTTVRSGSYITGTRAWLWTLVTGLRSCPLIGLSLLTWTFTGRWSWLCRHVGAALPPCGGALALVGAPALACGPALLGPCGPYAPGSGGTPRREDFDYG